MARSEKSLSKDIYDEIKEDVIYGRIKDGHFLTLNELVTRFSVSKTPIRDALSALEIEGYLQSFVRKGYLVTPITQNNIRERFQMRLILEIAVVEIAIKTAEDHELQGILALAEKFPEKTQEESLIKFNKINIDFHMAVGAATHNSILVDSYSDSLENLARILMADSRNLDLTAEIEEHREIAEAILRRDTDRAIELTKAHNLNLRNRVVEDNTIF